MKHVYDVMPTHFIVDGRPTSVTDNKRNITHHNHGVTKEMHNKHKQNENKQRQRHQQPGEHTVSFAPESTVRFYPVERVIDLSTEQFDATWYNADDLEMIRAENKDTVKLMKSGREANSSERFGYCYRGLEFKLSSIGKRRKLHQSRAFKAVYQEQRRQNSMFDDDPELLATIYQGYASVAVEAATRQAELDANIAAIIVKEETNKPKSFAENQSQLEGLDFDELSDDDDDDNVSLLSDDFNNTDGSLRSDDSSTTSSIGSPVVRRIKKILRRASLGRKRREDE